MKVGVIATSYPRYPGDKSGHWIHRANRELRHFGVDVTVLAPHAPGLPVRHEIDRVPIIRFRYLWPAAWQRVAYRPGGLPYWGKFPAAVRMQFIPYTLSLFAHTLWLARQCDLIHAHWTLAGLAALGSRLVAHRPYVLSLRGSDVNIGLNSSEFARKLFAFVACRSDALISVSQAIKAVVEQELNIDNVLLLENGVDIETYRPLDGRTQRLNLGLADDAKVILSVGNLVRLKGYNYLVEALPAIVAAHPQAMLVLIGDGEEREPLREQAAALGMTDRVYFTGYLPTTQIPAWLNAADVFVLPSLSEGRPNVILEAMACGRLVVATRVGGIPEIVEDSQTGFLVAPQQPDQLAERISLLLDNPELSQRLGLAGRQSFIDKGLTWEHHAERLIGVYSRVLSQAREATS